MTTFRVDIQKKKDVILDPEAFSRVKKLGDKNGLFEELSVAHGWIDPVSASVRNTINSPAVIGSKMEMKIRTSHSYLSV